MAKTAMQILVDEMKKHELMYSASLWLINQMQLIEFEKQQIIDAAKWMPKPYHLIEFTTELAEQYYNEQFKQQ